MNRMFQAAVLTPLLAWVLSGAALAQANPAAAKPATDSAAVAGNCPAVLQHSFKRLQDEAPQNMCQYAGKVVLVVNTASYCGFTKQYEGLEALYAKYSGQGLVVLGFPSNDFGGQEPGKDKDIAEFCFNTYGVKFPMLSKSSVKGSAANPMFKQLATMTGDTPSWNFHKYLIGRNGTKATAFGSMTEPGSKTLVSAIEKALAER